MLWRVLLLRGRVLANVVEVHIRCQIQEIELVFGLFHAFLVLVLQVELHPVILLDVVVCVRACDGVAVVDVDDNIVVVDV